MPWARLLLIVADNIVLPIVLLMGRFRNEITLSRYSYVTMVSQLPDMKCFILVYTSD